MLTILKIAVYPVSSPLAAYQSIPLFYREIRDNSRIVSIHGQNLERLRCRSITNLKVNVGQGFCHRTTRGMAEARDTIRQRRTADLVGDTPTEGWKGLINAVIDIQ